MRLTSRLLLLTGYAVVSVALASAASKSSLVENYGRLPIAFEANRGQAETPVKFLARGNGYGLFLTGSEAVLALHAAKTKADVIRMQLQDANPSTAATGLDLLPGTANYFIGNDPSKWHTNVATYSKVQFSGVYPGVDLLYYGNQSQFEFDFIVAPQADPNRIRLHFAGASKLSLNAAGDLVVAAPHGQVAFHKPFISQEMPDGRRQAVPGHFALAANHSVAFRLGRYDHSEPLVIDPVLVFSTYLGGTITDAVSAVVADGSGNAYVTGWTDSADFPVTAGAFHTTGPDRTYNAFVSKLDSTGTALLYSTFLGGSTQDDGYAIALDSSGNAYVAGFTDSSDFPVTPGAYQTINKGGANGSSAFVTKLNATGTALIYSTLLGGSSYDYAFAIAVNGGNAYVAGYAQSSDFPVTSGAFQTVNAGPSNAFVAEFDLTGKALVFSTYLGGNGFDNAYGIALDSGGNVYVAGLAHSTDFPVTTSAFQTTNKSSQGTAFVTKFDPKGETLLYSTYLGGSYREWSSTIAVDGAGDAYVAGSTLSPDFPVTAGAFQTTKKTPSNSSTAYVAKFDPKGSRLLYSTYLSGTTDEGANGIAVDSSGNAYVTGFAGSPDFPVTSDALQKTLKGPFFNAFVSEFNATGSGLLYSTFLGGTGLNGNYDVGLGIALDTSRNIYVGGQTASRDFPVTAGAFQQTNKSTNITGFVAKFNSAAIPTPEFSPAPGKYDPSVMVKITYEDPSAPIYYTLNGSTPTAESLLYTGPLTLSSYSGVLLKAIALPPGGTAPTPVTQGFYTILHQTPTPVLSPLAGSYASGQKVTITDANLKATIRYTTDGSAPTTQSKLYQAPVTLTSSETIRAIAISTGDATSNAVSAAYTIH